jgi:hypothetical protein
LDAEAAAGAATGLVADDDVESPPQADASAAADIARNLRFIVRL